MKQNYANQLYQAYRHQHDSHSLFRIMHPNKEYPRDWNDINAPTMLDANQFWLTLVSTAFADTPINQNKKNLHYLITIAGINTGLVSHQWNSDKQLVETKLSEEAINLLTL